MKFFTRSKTIVLFSFVIIGGLSTLFTNAASIEDDNIIVTAFPGSYVVTIKGLMTDGKHFTKLAMFSFQPGGTLRQDFWIWYDNIADANSVYANTLQIGFVQQLQKGDLIAAYPANLDQNKSIVNLSNFASGNYTTRYGQWSENGNSLQITWPWGDTEQWELIWSDPHLNKIELVSASYLKQDSVGVTSAGWGFGGPGEGFNQNQPDITKNQKNLSGLYIRHDAWVDCAGGENPDQPIIADSMNLENVFLITTTNVLRNVRWDGIVNHWVFSYLGFMGTPAGGDPLLSRRSVYQTGHDFDNNGEIQGDIGHIYAGLQIIDSLGQFRGYVFSDVSPAISTPKQTFTCGSNHTISSLFYVDTKTTDLFSK